MQLTPNIPEGNIAVQGQFMASQYTGLLPAGLAAGADIFSFQWKKPDLDAVIHYFKWFWYTVTAFGAAQIVDHSLFKSMKATTNPSGGTDIRPPVGKWNAKKTTHADSVLWDGTNPGAIQIAQAVALTPGDRTLSTVPFEIRAAVSNAINAGMFDPDMNRMDESHKNLMGLYLVAGEGLVLQNNTLLGATGVVKVGIEIGWSEIKPCGLSSTDV